MTSGMVLHHSSPYPFKTGPLPEPGLRLATSKPSNSPASTSLTVLRLHIQHFTQCWEFKLRSSGIHSKCSYPLSPLPRPEVQAYTNIHTHTITHTHTCMHMQKYLYINAYIFTGTHSIKRPSDDLKRGELPARVCKLQHTVRQ